MPSHLWRTLLLLLLCLLIGGPACGVAPSARPHCTLDAHFLPLQQQLGQVVGACQADPVQHPELAEVTQPTSTGQLTYRSLDNVVGFSNGTSTWVLDPNDPTGQVRMRDPDQRFPFEFNPDGFLIVGQAGPSINGTCPATPVRVLAVENFYADLVKQLGGQCVAVTAILSDPSADPHEFQPSAADVRAYQTAQLVIENGLGYDDFSDRILATLGSQPTLIRVGDVLGLQTGANPHVWYSAPAVRRVRDEIHAQLTRLEPASSAYFEAQASAVNSRFATYDGLLAQIRSRFAGSPIGATESIVQGMADSTGLNVVTPGSFMQAVAEGDEPAARDVALFQTQIQNGQMQVLVYNTQTVTGVTDQLETLAQQHGIPLVGVSETMPDGVQTFQGWQATQLALLLRALEHS